VKQRHLYESLEEGVLPPFVLLWRTGFTDWLPAYLVPDFRAALGSDDLVLHSLPEAPDQTEPPTPPLEWYIECLGEDAGHTTLAQERDSTPSLLDLDWNDFDDENAGFSENEAPTQRRPPMRSLPAAAFPNADAYLSHIRSYARRRQG
jgi:hypothetical protein